MEPADRSVARADVTTGQDHVTVCHVVTFRLGSDTFALPVDPVKQILPMLAITPLPRGAGALVDSLLGAINLHGQIIPVVDLCRHLGLPHVGLKRDTPLIVARVGALAVSLIVDEVIDVLSVRACDVAPPGDVLPVELGQAPLLAGLVRVPGPPGGHLALLLDVEHLFEPDQREALVRVLDLIRQQAVQAQGGVG
jgi:chemotaxis signal transduction protein